MVLIGSQRQKFVSVNLLFVLRFHWFGLSPEQGVDEYLNLQVARV